MMIKRYYKCEDPSKNFVGPTTIFGFLAGEKSMYYSHKDADYYSHKETDRKRHNYGADYPIGIGLVIIENKNFY